MNGASAIVQEVHGEDNLPAAENTPAKSSPFIIEPAKPEESIVIPKQDEQADRISETETNRKDEE
jgi:hypothetical protein